MFYLFLLFIIVPLAELYVIIQVGQAIGVLPTIALLLLDAILGSVLMRAQGRAAWARFTAATQAGRPPAREVLDGMLVIFGGAFLLTPGFISDVFGLIFLLPPTRALARRFIVRQVLRRTPAGRVAMFATRRAEGAAWGGNASDVEGTAHEVDSDPPRLP